MTINFNGKEMIFESSLSISELLKKIDVDGQRNGIALCLNLEVLPKNEWEDTQLSDQDRIDLVVAAPGG
jgi:sulfur carrier protein